MTTRSSCSSPLVLSNLGTASATSILVARYAAYQSSSLRGVSPRPPKKGENITLTLEYKYTLCYGETMNDKIIKHKLLESWFPIKERKHNTSPRKIPRITEGEVWWVAVGENVGVEINGKSEYYSRPVLIFKKLSHLGFMGIPLTIQEHSGSWYVNFRFQSKEVYAALSQAKTFSSARLYTRLGQVAEDDMATIKKGFCSLYLNE